MFPTWSCHGSTFATHEIEKRKQTFGLCIPAMGLCLLFEPTVGLLPPAFCEKSGSKGRQIGRQNKRCGSCRGIGDITHFTPQEGPIKSFSTII